MKKSYDIAVAAAMPDVILKNYLPDKPKGRVIIVGGGKASALMAQALEKEWGDICCGLVVTRYGHVVATQYIEVMEAAHPVPDENGVKATEKMMGLLDDVTPDDLVLCLLSGGGSSLMACPEGGLAFEEVQALNRDLLHSGASIHEINCVRKHLNRAFGGKLARAARPAKLVTLSISDVAGDDPSVIASGPTVPDPTTLADALAVIDRYAITISSSIRDFLMSASNETPKSCDMPNIDYRLIATPIQSLEAAKIYLESQGITTVIESDSVEGDTNEIAEKISQDILNNKYNLPRPYAVLSGGETTVQVRNPDGQGGPNTQFVLASAIYLNGEKSIYAFAADTDGIDGNVENAGAYMTPDTVAQLGGKAKDYLENNDSYNAFKSIRQTFEIGPTHTNVNDFRVFVCVE